MRENLYHSLSLLYAHTRALGGADEWRDQGAEEQRGRGTVGQRGGGAEGMGGGGTGERRVGMG